MNAQSEEVVNIAPLVPSERSLLELMCVGLITTLLVVSYNLSPAQKVTHVFYHATCGFADRGHLLFTLYSLFLMEWRFCPKCKVHYKDIEVNLRCSSEPGYHTII